MLKRVFLFKLLSYRFFNKCYVMVFVIFINVDEILEKVIFCKLLFGISKGLMVCFYYLEVKRFVLEELCW